MNHGRSILGWKPKLAVARFDPTRPATSVTLDVEHAVAPSVGNRSERAAAAFGKLIQLIPVCPMNAAVGTHPKITTVVFENLEDAIVKQTFLHGEARKFPIFEAAQAAIVRTNPQHAVGILIQRAHMIAGQSIAFCPGGKASVLQPCQAAVRADPKRAALNFNDHLGGSNDRAR